MQTWNTHANDREVGINSYRGEGPMTPSELFLVRGFVSTHTSTTRTTGKQMHTEDTDTHKLANDSHVLRRIVSHVLSSVCRSLQVCVAASMRKQGQQRHISLTASGLASCRAHDDDRTATWAACHREDRHRVRIAHESKRLRSKEEHLADTFERGATRQDDTQ